MGQLSGDLAWAVRPQGLEAGVRPMFRIFQKELARFCGSWHVRAMDVSAPLSGMFRALIADPDAPAARLVLSLARRGEASAPELAADTAMSRSAVSGILTDLRQRQMVLDVATRQGGLGRPMLLHGLNPAIGTCAGILLGLEEIRVSLCDVTHRVLTDESVPLARDYSPDQAARTVAETLAAHAAQCGLTTGELVGVGIAVSAPVSPDGAVLAGSILPTWGGVDLGRLFGPTLGCPIHATNESNCGALAELMWGAAQGEPDFVMVKFDLGIGGAIILNGALMTGAHGSAAEFGHMTLNPRGALCRCGNRGCLETVIGGTELLRQAHLASGRDLTLASLGAAAADGHTGFRRLLDDAAETAGWGLGLIGMALDPPLFVLTGGLTQADPGFVDRVAESYGRHAMGMVSGNDAPVRPRFVTGAYLGNDTVLGAAALVLRQDFRVTALAR
jgi:predicted NBD/HSP70 family sugar kinase